MIISVDQKNHNDVIPFFVKGKRNKLITYFEPFKKVKQVYMTFNTLDRWVWNFNLIDTIFYKIYEI